MTGGSQRQPLRIVVLISGGGRTLVNFLRLRALGQLDVDIPLVISSSSKAKGLDHARDAGIPTQVIARGAYESDADYGTAMFAAIRAVEPQLVVMAGYLKFLPIPDDFALRVVNIHPSLIPEFCGHGMYGHHVHEAVIAAGAKVTGCTVHYVDNQYDHGPIILQKSVPVQADDTPDTLAARVFEAECVAFPEALRRIAAGQVKVG
jgi:formyltetrahydrofolate-dependent phosphoribosylglycinamide formyltransferase